MVRNKKPNKEKEEEEDEGEKEEEEKEEEEKEEEEVVETREEKDMLKEHLQAIDFSALCTVSLTMSPISLGINKREHTIQDRNR